MALFSLCSGHNQNIMAGGITRQLGQDLLPNCETQRGRGKYCLILLSKSLQSSVGKVALSSLGNSSFNFKSLQIIHGNINRIIQLIWGALTLWQRKIKQILRVQKHIIAKTTHYVLNTAKTFTEQTPHLRTIGNYCSFINDTPYSNIIQSHIEQHTHGLRTDDATLLC